jgi:xylulokinase
VAAVHDVPVERVTGEASPVGAAMLAGVGLGQWSDVQQAARVCVDAVAVERPGPDAVRRYREARDRYAVAADALSGLGRRMEVQACSTT